jgi:pyrimidine and pyridine-specific 5'-nucleotidase
MRPVQKKGQVDVNSAIPASTSSPSKSSSKASSYTPRKSNGTSSIPSDGAKPKEQPRYNDLAKQPVQEGARRVGVLPLADGALEVGDDGRSLVWLDIDNTLYSKGTRIAQLMTERIRAFIKGLGLDDDEVERLHQKYYKEYGLAIRGLVMHHKIDALEYDAKCDATLPLEDVLVPDESLKSMLRDLDRGKCRVWALTNAYKTVSIRVDVSLYLFSQRLHLYSMPFEY